MLTIECKGSPYEIGFNHGHAAAEAVGRSKSFYEGLFMRYSKKTWPEVLQMAREFQTVIKVKWPNYHEEMQGIADGSNLDLLDVIALNVRTEIAFGLFSDGCTSVYCKTSKQTLLGQNWDWMPAQKQNLILMTIHQASLPTIKMVTEAGIIGKIGFNSDGVGVCFNAIRVRGVDSSRMPAHLGLRHALEHSSARSAVESLEAYGMASAAYSLIGDANEAIGLEYTSRTTARQHQDEHGRVIHTNHLLGNHSDVRDARFLYDSPSRIDRMRTLTSRFNPERAEPTQAEFSELFEDQQNLPGAICRANEGYSDAATLFNIVMDLAGRRAVVRLGRPCAPEGEYTLAF